MFSYHIGNEQETTADLKKRSEKIAYSVINGKGQNGHIDLTKLERQFCKLRREMQPMRRADVEGRMGVQPDMVMYFEEGIPPPAYPNGFPKDFAIGVLQALDDEEGLTLYKATFGKVYAPSGI